MPLSDDVCQIELTVMRARCQANLGDLAIRPVRPGMVRFHGFINFDW
jgi:hypothetical protein